MKRALASAMRGFFAPGLHAGFHPAFHPGYKSEYLLIYIAKD
jgi:hypothetical protein